MFCFYFYLNNSKKYGPIMFQKELKCIQAVGELFKKLCLFNVKHARGAKRQSNLGFYLN